MLAKTDRIIADEAMVHINKFAHSAADALPEYNYWILSSATVLGPAIVHEIRHSPAIVPNSEVIGATWNYVDGGCSIAIGLLQLADTYHHRPLVNKLKGFFNCASGTQSIALTALSFATLGGPAFAIAGGIGFALSIDETIRMGRRKHNFDYWVKDNLAELDKINSVILPDLRRQIAELNKISAEQKGRVSNWALTRKTHRLEEFIAKKEEIEHDLTHRLALRKYSDTNPLQAQQYQKELNSLTDRLAPKSTNIKKYHEDTRSFLQTLADAPKPADLTSSYAKEQEIIKKNARNFKDASYNSFIWGVAFVGMLCICFPVPGAQIVGFTLIGLASALYLIKHAQQISQGMRWVADRFFKPERPSKYVSIAPSTANSSESYNLDDPVDLKDLDDLDDLEGSPFNANDL